jgi:hypothetical protein
MTKRCINPECRNEFQHMSSGTLYALENDHLDTRFVWLCEGCAVSHALAVDAAGAVAICDRSAVVRHTSQDFRTRLRLVCASRNDSPWHRHGLATWEAKFSGKFASVPTAA